MLVYDNNCDQICDTCHYRATHGFFSTGAGKRLYFECSGCAQRVHPRVRLETAIAHQVFVTAKTGIILRPEIAEERVIDPIREVAFKEQIISELRESR